MGARRRLLLVCAVCWLLAAVLLAPSALLAAEGGGTTLPAPAQVTPAEQAAPAQQQQPPAAGPVDTPEAPQQPPPAATTDARADSEGAAVDAPRAIAAAARTVTISDFEFSPASITVSVGDTVTWTNQGPSGHSATANDDSFDTGVLSKGRSGSHRFTRAGTFSYICKPHPFMKGTVRVRGAGGGGGGSSTGGGGGSSGAAGDEQAGSSGSAPAAGTGGRSLPATGADPGLLAAFGLALLAIGAVARRQAQQRR